MLSHQTLASIEEIKGLISRYCIGMDGGRLHDVMAVFAVDATLSMFGESASGAHDIRALLEGLGGRAAGVQGLKSTRHMITTQQVDLTSAESATSKTYVVVMTNMGIDNWGFYSDELKRLGGSWLISRRRLVVDGYTPRGIGALMSDGEQHGS